MPEVTDNPITTTVLESAPYLGPALETISKTKDLRIPTFKEIGERIAKITTTVRSINRNVDDETFNTVAYLLAGPWLLEGGPAQKEIPSNQQKELSAILQHNYSHHVLFGQSPMASEKFRISVYGLMNSLEKSAEAPAGIEYNVIRFLNGVRAEVAIARTLLNSGYRVILPDYTEQSDPRTGKLSQTMQWDVNRGIDMVVIDKKSNVFFVDCKGRRYAKTDQGTIINRRVQVGKSRPVVLPHLPPSLRAVLQKVIVQNGQEIGEMRFARIEVPTHETEMEKIGKRGDGSSSYLEALNKFGHLKPEHEVAILQGLKELKYDTY